MTIDDVQIYNNKAMSQTSLIAKLLTLQMSVVVYSTVHCTNVYVRLCRVKLKLIIN